jgi:glycosyltransferase involved in cell wall biosynthesis
MPHLAFVVNNADFLVSHRLVLVKGALAAGFRVTAIAPAGPGLEVLRSIGASVIPWRLRRTGQKPHEEALALAHLVSVYRDLKPDLVHHVTVKAMLYGSVAARLSGIHAVVNAVSGLGYVFLSSGWRAQFRRQMLKSGYRFALNAPGSAVILQNDDDEAELHSLGVLGGARVVKIRGSGVDLNRFVVSDEPSGELPLVVLPARLLVDKGVREFMAAARILKGQGLQARFALVGGEDEGNPASVPLREVHQAVADGVVEWWGHRNDMPDVLRQANIVCLPSYREGMPKALLEAAAIGRAIVTTDVPGCRDAVAHGEIGQLVPARDVASLAQTLGELLVTPESRVRWARLASAHARKNFSEDAVLASHLELYRELLVR